MTTFQTGIISAAQAVNKTYMNKGRIHSGVLFLSGIWIPVFFFLVPHQEKKE
jgi:hypothetical protein